MSSPLDFGTCCRRAPGEAPGRRNLTYPHRLPRFEGMPSRTAEPVEGQTTEHRERRPPFAAPHVWVLAVVRGEEPDAVYRLVQYETLVGRGEGADIDLSDPNVSKRHCLLRVEGPVCTVKDLGSRNGTRVNGRKQQEDVAVRLRHLDEIQAGDTHLFVLNGAFRRQPTR